MTDSEEMMSDEGSCIEDCWEQDLSKEDKLDPYRWVSLDENRNTMSVSMTMTINMTKPNLPLLQR